jgi:hypothetical protein
VIVVVPEHCRHCQQPFPEPAGRRRGRVWCHQVVELLPLAVRVTEYQMLARRCLALSHLTFASPCALRIAPAPCQVAPSGGLGWRCASPGVGADPGSRQQSLKKAHAGGSDAFSRQPQDPLWVIC